METKLQYGSVNIPKIQITHLADRENILEPRNRYRAELQYLNLCFTDDDIPSEDLEAARGS